MLARHLQQELPLWFERGLIIVTAVVLGWGGGGLLLADTGVFSAWRAGAFGVGGLALGVLAALRYRRDPVADTGTPDSRLTMLPAAGMVVVAAASALWNGYYAGQHISVGRDPGVYTAAGKWLATHGNLIVPSGQNLGGSAALGATPAGTYVSGGNTFQFQFAHMLPAMLAEADHLGGDMFMFRLVPIVGAVALCFVYAAGCRLVRRSWLVLAAVTGLAVCLPEIAVVRDNFSEPLSQLLLWSGIWLLLLALSRSTVRGAIGIAVLGGAALGGTFMAHIDAPAYLIAVPILAAGGWLARSGDERAALTRLYAAAAAGAIPPIALGTLDVQRRSAGYYHYLHHSVMSLYLACGAMTVAAAVLVVAWPRLGTARSLAAAHRMLARHRDRLGTAAGLLAGAVLLLGWLVRPHLQQVHSAITAAGASYAEAIAQLQQHAGVAVDPTRTYAEQTLVWFKWYIGPVALAAAILGFVVLVRRLVRAPSAALAMIVLMPGSLTVIYLWNPNISTDQIWASRRFIPASLPLFAIAAAAGVAALAQFAGRRTAWPAVGRGILVLGAAGLLVLPLRTIWSVRDQKPQAGYLGVLDQICATVGPDAAVVYTSGGTGDRLVLGTWAWCNVPANSLQHPISPPELSELAATWKAQGRTLWILGTSTHDVTTVTGVAQPKLIGTAADSRELEITLVAPPSDYAPQPLTVYGVPID